MGHLSIESLADQTFHIWVSEVSDKLALLMHFSIHIHIHTHIYKYIYIYVLLLQMYFLSICSYTYNNI